MKPEEPKLKATEPVKQEAAKDEKVEVKAEKPTSEKK